MTGIEMTKFTMAALMLGLLLTGARAQAATAGACAIDMQRLCPKLTGHAAKQCRNNNHNRFSVGCKQSLASANMKVKDLK
jgi:hypothetical protein